MPGAVARTSTFALNNATLPFVLALAGGYKESLLRDPHLRNGLNVYQGRITHRAVAEALKLEYTPAEKLLAS
jgi:alanine dehydrogenase